MTYTVPFDTLVFAKELEANGVPVAQAEAYTRVLLRAFQQVEAFRREALVTQGDVADVRREAGSAVEELRKDIDVAKAELRKDLEPIKGDLLRWMVAISAGQAVLIVALIKLLPGGH